ncbi:MAG: SusC/RagA family TonB-linked outer membrane protein [Saprospiraceae bacterium]|nr:SusC/RagA family TonB-linked outer membrane protein [Saprospiraceae bacterium]
MKLRFNYFSQGLLLVAGLLLSNWAFAQRTISGTVTDAASKEPLIGANVLVVGTSSGTITDIDGTYSISVPAGATELEFSYTGYNSQKVTIGTSNSVDVSLSAGRLLDEVVVVGYGTQKSKEVTSSVTSVKAEDFNRGNVNDPAQLIQGKVAGLSIARPGADPNGGFTVRLRGLSTLGANTQPLIIIDGLIGGSLNLVDPNDIETIDVLKDGSAAAIYGTRASSGVIIITTKKGRRGFSNVEYNGYMAAESIARQVQTASASEFVRLRGQNVNRGSETDWMDQVTQTGISQVHNLALSGGLGNGSTYRASVNFRDVNGIGIGSGFNQFNGRLNLSQKALNDRLTIDFNLGATEREADYAFVEAFRYATLYNPTAPVRFADNSTNPLANKYGGYYQEENFDYFNPLAILEQGSNVGSIKGLVLGGRADYKLAEGLTISSSYTIQRENRLFGQYYDSNAYFRGFNRQGLATRSTQDDLSRLFELHGTYQKQLGTANLNILGGYSFQENTFQGFNAENGNFISNDLGFNNLNFGLDLPNARANMGSYKSLQRVIAFFGRVNLNVDDTYFLSASVRQEGSTLFGEGNKWGLFPAVSAGVTLSNLIDIKGVDNMKLRAGYGETGSLPPSGGLSQLLFSRQGSFFFNGAFVPAIGPGRNANPDLRWETKGEFNVGLDLSMLDYKLTASIDYYQRRTRDLIFQVNVPVPPNLAARTWANLEDAALTNNGLEIALGYTLDKGKFRWNPNLVFATFNTVLDTVSAPDAKFKFFQSGGQLFDFSTSPGAPGLNNTPTMVVQAGQPLGQFWGPTFIGVKEGRFEFEDRNGDGMITDADFGVIGNGLPKFSLGLNNTFQVGNFDINVFIRGDFGHELANMYRVFYEPLGTGSRDIENIVQTKYFDETLRDAPRFSSHYIEKADYLVLDNATLGYSFNLPKGKAFSKLRVYLAGQNLFYITSYTGVDPSPRYADAGDPDNGGFQNLNGNPLFPGLDRRNTYFRARTVTIGANVTF